ncbi:hypothetical protein D3C75_1188350 [compost metagenome]
MLAVQLLNQRAQVTHFTMGIRVLQQSAEYLVLGKVIHSVDDQFETKTFSPGLQHGQCLRVAVFIGKESIALVARHAFGQGHGFGCGGGFIEQ